MVLMTEMLTGGAFATGVLDGKVFVNKNIFDPTSIRPEKACCHEAFMAKALAAKVLTTEVLTVEAFTTRALGLALKTKLTET